MKKPYITIKHHSGVGQKFKVVDENPFAFLTEALGAIGQFWLPKSEYLIVQNWETVDFDISDSGRILFVIDAIGRMPFTLPENYHWRKTVGGTIVVEKLQ